MSPVSHDKSLVKLNVYGVVGTEGPMRVIPKADGAK